MRIKVVAIPNTTKQMTETLNVLNTIEFNSEMADKIVENFHKGIVFKKLIDKAIKLPSVLTYINNTIPDDVVYDYATLGHDMTVVFEELLDAEVECEECDWEEEPDTYETHDDCECCSNCEYHDDSENCPGECPLNEAIDDFEELMNILRPGFITDLPNSKEDVDINMTRHEYQTIKRILDAYDNSDETESE